MILTLFSFGISWAIYAFAFFILASHLSGFHSSYMQSTFLIGFTVGFVNALIIKSARVMAFEVPMGLLYLLIAGVDFLLIMATSNFPLGYYVTGHKSAVIVSVALAVIAFITEFVKEKFRADVR